MDLTKDKIPKLVKGIAIPASIGFFFNTMYNVVDTFYGGLISTQALAALSLSFPIFFLIIAFGSGLSTGTTALIANALGARNKKEASKFTAQSISFSIILSFFLTILGFLISPYLFTLLGAEGSYLDLSLSYMNIIFAGTIFFILAFIFNSPLQASGDTKSFRNFLIFGFILNLILDPWFMFGGLGIPALGLSGIALATVLIELLGAIYLGYKIKKKGLLKNVRFKEFIPSKSYFKEIAKQGFPAGLNMMTVALGIFVITYFISKFGSPAVAAYGIATRIEQIFLLPTIGLNIATLSLVGQNMGAKKYDRIKETLKTTIKYGSIIMTIGFVVILIFSSNLMFIFTNDTEVISIGSFYLKIAAFLTWAYVFLFITVSALQGMKHPMFALWIGLARQIIAPLIIFSLLIYVFNFELLGVWIGVFIINWTAAIISLVYANKVIKKYVRGYSSISSS